MAYLLLSCFALTSPSMAGAVSITSGTASIYESPNAKTAKAHLIAKDEATVLDFVGGASDGFFRITFTNAQGVTTEGYIKASDAHAYHGEAMSVAVEKAVLFPTRSATDASVPYVVSGNAVVALSTSGSWTLVAYEPSHTVGWVATSALKKAQ